MRTLFWQMMVSLDVSRTLDKVEWNNSRLLKDNVAEALIQARARSGRPVCPVARAGGGSSPEPIALRSTARNSTIK